MTSLARRVAQFWERVDQSGGPDACWPWTGACDQDGYGTFGRIGERRAHRIVSALLNGPIPEGIVIRHTCDNPPCCNPRHLRRGTHADNVRDKHERGRYRPPPRRIPDGAVILLPGEAKRAAARRLGVSHRTIGRYLDRAS